MQAKNQTGRKKVRLFSRMRDTNGRLYHRYREGEAAVPAFLDDYAFLIWGLVELYEATFESAYISKALELNAILLEHFWDHDMGGFYFTANDADQILVRKKGVHDGALPSGNSVSLMNLLRLSRLTAHQEYEDKAGQLVRAFSKDISEMPVAHTQFLLGLDFALGPTSEVIVVGDPQSQDTKNMLETLRGSYSPHKVVIFRPAQQEDANIARLAEFTARLSTVEGKATAYVCKNFRCDVPTTDPQHMLTLITE